MWAGHSIYRLGIRPDGKNMLVCRHPTRSKFFMMFSPEQKKIFSRKYIILAMLTLESKVNNFPFVSLAVHVVLTFLTHRPLRRFP